MNETPAIEVRHLVKAFGTFKANDDVSIAFYKGQVHALLGENGAGKSTLMNMLSGIYVPTSGQILVKGKEVKLHSAKEATELGIGMVHQHFMLVGAFTVLENIILGSEPTTAGRLNLKTARRKVEEILKHYDLDVDLDARVDDISVGMQQRVEIVKVLYREADVLIFDEPTASLTPQEIDDLLDIMRQLAKEDKAVILITHKLKEIRAVADITTIIRRGRVIDTVKTSDESAEDLATKMVGRPVDFDLDKTAYKKGEPILQIDHLNVADKMKIDRVSDFTLTVHAGEIVGLAGIDGNGQSELVKAITGLMPVRAGKITIGGKDTTHATPRAIVRDGVGHIPEDRQRYGLILPMTVIDNMGLMVYNMPPLAKHGLRNEAAGVKMTEELTKKFDVRTSSIRNSAGSLSGGNQQKLIIAREMSRDPQLLIAMNPTRGLDVGAIEFIHQQILNARDEGHAVLLVSYELDEVKQLADTIAVVHAGKLVATEDAAKLSESQIGLLMAGEDIDGKEAAADAN
ncbi:ABC transporter ATP-binding protein [Lacticaseibacillus pabuli]|uniref:ABC transporter ATP-binding protein n=1 Tax=Lacticaseibacillus pabuli TaxID=3025672 RepID=A0ABY7WUP6_9LACO|nr:ABC transporter ATP-binding protein [Lacticaseibacillus sp. KACC 23028]WDF83183.1 ABC transporter ATP-binding protein [Lacticaseibacillus sp. KACC 23028]